MFGRGQRSFLYGDEEFSSKEVTLRFGGNRRKCGRPTDAGSSGRFVSGSANPSGFKSEGEGTSDGASNCTGELKLSGRHACSPGHRGPREGWLATLRTAFYFQELQEGLINQVIQILQSVAFHGHFFSFPLKKRREEIHSYFLKKGKM